MGPESVAYVTPKVTQVRSPAQLGEPEGSGSSRRRTCPVDPEPPSAPSRRLGVTVGHRAQAWALQAGGTGSVTERSVGVFSAWGEGVDPTWSRLTPKRPLCVSQSGVVEGGGDTPPSHFGRRRVPKQAPGAGSERGAPIRPVRSRWEPLRGSLRGPVPAGR